MSCYAQKHELQNIEPPTQRNYQNQAHPNQIPVPYRFQWHFDWEHVVLGVVICWSSNIRVIK